MSNASSQRSRDAVFSSSAFERLLESSISDATAVLKEKRWQLCVTRWMVAWRSRSRSASDGAVGRSLGSRSAAARPG